MKKIKFVQVVGARPQLIKYFPVQKAIENYNERSEVHIEDILIHTGQHYDYMMSEAFFKELGIKKPKYHLEVGSASHGAQTGLILQRVEEVLLKEKPDLVVVYGDTNSTLGGALSAAKRHIPIAHIEAGLRSYNRYMPEEINRVLTDHLSSVLLCPTKVAAENLIKEGFHKIIYQEELIPKDGGKLLDGIRIDISNSIVLNVGDVMYDVVLLALEMASQKSRILQKFELNPKNYFVLTLHRAENTDDPERLKEIRKFVGEIASGNTVMFPVHPRTEKVIKASGAEFAHNVRMVEPLGYFDMIWLVKNCAFILTDSGGLQKEAYWLKVPCITLRDETEWTETVQSSWNVLYKDYKGRNNPSEQNTHAYGDGMAAKRIVKIIIELLDG